jgi:tetratricopeptide (TPR) repeat protein
MANALNDLGNVTQMQGDLESARTYYQQSLELETKTRNARGVAVAKFNLGNCARRLGKLDQAQQYFEQSQQGFEAAENRREAAFPLNGLALVALAKGNLEQAMVFAQKSLGIRTSLVDKRGISESQRTIGMILLRQQDLPTGYDSLAKSLDLARSLQDQRGIAETIEQFASAAAMTKQFATSTFLYGAVERIRDKIGLRRGPLEQRQSSADLAAASAQLGEREFQDQHQAGRSMPLSEIIDKTQALRRATGEVPEI